MAVCTRRPAQLGNRLITFVTMTSQQAFKIISEYFKDKPVRKVSVFGSYATGKNTPDSDIDLILSLDKPLGLIKLSGYRLDLEEKLGIPVDLGTENGVSSFILPYIKNDIKIIYEHK